MLASWKWVLYQWCTSKCLFLKFHLVLDLTVFGFWPQNLLFVCCRDPNVWNIVRNATLTNLFKLTWMGAIAAPVLIVCIKGRVSFQQCLFVIFLLMLNSKVKCFLLVAEGWKMGGKKQVCWKHWVVVTSMTKTHIGVLESSRSEAYLPYLVHKPWCLFQR